MQAVQVWWRSGHCLRAGVNYSADRHRTDRHDYPNSQPFFQNPAKSWELRGKKLSISIKIHSSQTAIESVWSVCKLSTESVGSRRELVANSVHTARTPTRRISTVESRRRCVLGIKDRNNWNKSFLPVSVVSTRSGIYSTKTNIHYSGDGGEWRPQCQNYTNTETVVLKGTRLTLGQMGHHFRMGHVGHWSLPVTHWPILIRPK